MSNLLLFSDYQMPTQTRETRGVEIDPDAYLSKSRDRPYKWWNTPTPPPFFFPLCVLICSSIVRRYSSICKSRNIPPVITQTRH